MIAVSEARSPASIPRLFSELRASISRLQPPEPLTIPKWAERYRYHSRGARPGPWRWEPAPHAIEPAEALTDPETEEVVCVWASQTSKSELALCAVGYFSHYDPSPILIIQPRVEDAEQWSKERLAPMISDSAALAAIFPEPRSRSTGNTIRHKETRLGQPVSMVGANAPAGLAARAVRVLVGDEVDRFPLSAGTEGDALRLGIVRQTTYYNRIRLLVSSPTIKGESRIWRRYERTDMCRRHLRCPHCGGLTAVDWNCVKWDLGPEDAHLECPLCAAAWSEGDRLKACAGGQWIPDRPERGKLRRGFWMGALASPLAQIPVIVEEFLDGHAHPDEHQVWLNTRMAELWEGDGETVPAEVVYENNRVAVEGVPDWVRYIVAGADVQADRIEVEVLGADAERRTISLGYEILEGDPRLPETDKRSPLWALDQLWERRFGDRRIQLAFVDAGYLFDEITAYTRRRAGRRIYAIRGEGGSGKAWLIGRSRNNRARALVWRLGVDSIKAAIYRYLTAAPGDPGYCQFPDTYELQHFHQLTAERVVLRHVAGHPVQIWELPPGRRNEVLDCRTYAMAALERLAPRRSAILRASSGYPQGYPQDSGAVTSRRIEGRALRERDAIEPRPGFFDRHRRR